MTVQSKIVAYVEGQPIPEPTECVAVPGEGHIIDTIHPLTGKTVCYGKTLEDCQREHPGATRMTIADWCMQKAARQDSPIEWAPVSEEHYWDMLGVVPPAYMGNGGFLVGEPWDHHAGNGQPRFAAYRKRGDIWETASRPMTVAEFKALGKE